MNPSTDPKTDSPINFFDIHFDFYALSIAFTLYVVRLSVLVWNPNNILSNNLNKRFYFLNQTTAMYAFLFIAAILSTGLYLSRIITKLKRDPSLYRGSRIISGHLCLMIIWMFVGGYAFIHCAHSYTLEKKLYQPLSKSIPKPTAEIAIAFAISIIFLISAIVLDQLYLKKSSNLYRLLTIGLCLISAIAWVFAMACLMVFTHLSLKLPIILTSFMSMLALFLLLRNITHRDKVFFCSIATILALGAVIIFLISPVLPTDFAMINATKGLLITVGVALSTLMSYRFYMDNVSSVKKDKIFNQDYILSKPAFDRIRIFCFILVLGTIASIVLGTIMYFKQPTLSTLISNAPKVMCISFASGLGCIFLYAIIQSLITFNDASDAAIVQISQSNVNNENNLNLP